MQNSKEQYAQKSSVTGFIVYFGFRRLYLKNPPSAPQGELDSLGIVISTPVIGGTLLPEEDFSLTFSQAMNRSTVETAINLFPGSYDPATNPTIFNKLQLTSVCDGKWRVRNPNSFPLSFRWLIVNTTTKGVGVVPGNSDVFFYTPTGPNSVRVLVGTQGQQTKTTNLIACTGAPFTFTWNSTSKTVKFKSTETLQTNTRYTLVVSTSAKRATGTQDTNAPYISTFLVLPPYTPDNIDPADMQRRYNEVYNSLGEREKRLVDNGEMLWNGYEFSVPSPLLTPTRVPQGGLTALQAQNPFNCPLEDTDPNNNKDHGTFFLLASKPGTAQQRVQKVSASFELPAGKNISNAQGQELFAILTAWGSDLGANSSTFDAGLGFQKSGWYMFTNRFVGGANLPPEEAYTARLYRLRNLDSSGNIIPEAQNTAPYKVNVTVELLDGKIKTTVEPTGNTAWVNPFNDEIQRDSATGKPAPAVLGGDEVNSDNKGNPIYNSQGQPTGAFNPFPDQVVPGINANGVDNRVSIQVDAARDYEAPYKDTKAPGIRVYNARINDKPWNATSEQNEFFGFKLICPSKSPEQVYTVSQGDTSTDTGITVDINVKNYSVHDYDRDGENDGDEVFAGTDPNIADSVAWGPGYNGPGWCYVPFGSFTPCPTSTSPLKVGNTGQSSSDSVLLLTGSNCTGTFSFVNTGSSNVTYQISPRPGYGLKIRSGNAKGTIAVGQSVSVTMQYVGEKSQFNKTVPGPFGSQQIVERKVGIFENGINLAMVTAKADSSCASQ